LASMLLFIYLFKNNNTGPKATNVLQKQKNKHTNTEWKLKHTI